MKDNYLYYGYHADDPDLVGERHEPETQESNFRLDFSDGVDVDDTYHAITAICKMLVLR